MRPKPHLNALPIEASLAQEKLDQLLHNQTSWLGQVGKSLERSNDYLKQRIQYFDRLAVLAGAVLAFSIPAFTSLRGSGHTVTHRYTSFWCAVSAWALLFLATIGAAVTHYLLVEQYAISTTEHERELQSVLFGNLNLLQKRLMRSVGGNDESLRSVPVPALSFQSRHWHGKLPCLLVISSSITLVACPLGILGIFLFLIFSSY